MGKRYEIDRSAALLEVRLMPSPDYELDAIALMRRTVRLLEHWRLTGLYIAGVLTLWLFLVYTGRI